MDNLRLGVLLSVSWIFLVVGFLLVALTLRKTYLWLMAVQRAGEPPTRYFNLQLQVRGRDGELGLHNFDYYPIVVAAVGTADLLLPDVEDTQARFRIDYRQGQAHLFSDSSILVNGVPKKQKLLRQDDRIIFGPYRLVFKDASIREQSPPIPGKPIFVWQFPVVALLLALSLLFKQAGTVPEDTMLLAKAAELQGAEQSSPVAVGTELSSDRLGSSEIEEVARERIPLSQRLRWFFSRGSEEEQLAEAEDQEPPRVESRSEESASAESGSRKRKTAEAVVREPQIAAVAGTQTVVPEPAPSARRPAEVAVHRQPVIPESAPPAQKPQVQNPAEGISSSRQTVAAPQPVPAGRPIPASEPPIDAVAEVPPPRSVDDSPVKGETWSLSQGRAGQQPPVLQASVLGTIVPAAVKNDGINPLEGMSFAKARSAPEISRIKVRVIPPGRPPEYFKADILFIHAHPDDESIDFGSLMAMASRSNKRIVTLLFTDGESGLDLYPQRKVGDIYPARILSGGPLSQVRVVEATRALSILGSEMYVRWGLLNRPYNTKADEVPPAEVIRGWGGEEQLVARLIEVLEGFRPAVVVSPDRHCEAYEHFEHEAVGQLVQTALERLRRSGKTFVKGHLLSIDPYQVDYYGGVTNLDARIRDAESGLAYRSIQALALKEHVTQRDASVIALSRLSHLPQEYYKAAYWELDESLPEYLK